MAKTILHADMNAFYASVELLTRPELRDKPVVVGGDPEKRHGIVLAKNDLAKAHGIKTAMTLFQACQRCPGLQILRPHSEKYQHYSQLAREIYNQYTDTVEPFGLDEAWLDVGGSARLFGDGRKIANDIRERVRRELGLTLSIGVSFSKVFAKLGSDMKKPDATTVISEGNYRELAWPLPVNDLLFVGPATTRKLHQHAIYTIGDLAQTDVRLLRGWLGAAGSAIYHFANGYDSDAAFTDMFGHGDEASVKSIGNSTTTPRDLVCEQDVALTAWVLAESVAERLRKQRLMCRTVQVSMRENDMNGRERQCKLALPTQLARELFDAAMALYRSEQPTRPLRNFGIRATDLVSDAGTDQLSLFVDEQQRQKRMVLERTMDSIRDRYGHFAVTRGSLMTDRQLTGFDPQRHNTNPCMRNNADMREVFDGTASLLH